MTKSTKPKKQSNTRIEGNVTGGNVIIGNDNTINVQEAIKTAYGLLTIPRPVTDFTGREAELAQLKSAFTNGAIITGLSGSGGIGKTELARKLAHEIAANYPDAQLNIDLLGTSEKPTSPVDVMRRLLEPFYQKLPDDETQLKGLYQETFANKKVLLLLDNAFDLAQVRPLIPPAPSAAIITSRQHFSLPEFGMREPLRLDVLSPEKADEFLRGASPKLNDAPDEEVAQLAKLCGHLPLALRVAASLLNDRPDWTAATLVNRLQDEYTRLKRLKRDGDHDVEAMLNLSYEQLNDDLKKHIRALGIFTAPFAKISAQAVLEIEDEEELDEILGKLIKRSFLNSQKSDTVVDNLYSLHDLTRLYAVQKLLEENDYEETLARYAEHFLRWGSEGDNLYQKGGENVVVGLSQFRFIWVHLYAAYERLLPAQKVRPQSADRWLSDFPGTCIYVLGLHLPPREKIFIMQSALEAARRLKDKQDEGAALGNLGNAYADLGEARKAIEFYEQALIIDREIGDRHGEGAALGNLGNAYAALGEAHKAIEFYEQRIKIAREIGDRRGEGNALGNLGIAHKNLGEARKAIEFYEKQLLIVREIGDRRGEGAALGNLGIAYAELGEARKAIEFYEQALIIDREIGDRRGEGAALGNLGIEYATLGEAHKAIEFYEQALIIDREIGDRLGEGATLGNLGIAHKNLGEARKAIEFYEKQLLIVREIGDRRGEGAALGNLGSAYADLGEARKAIEFYEQRIKIAREIGDRRGEGNVLANLGLSYEKLAEKEKARKVWQEALEILRAIESPHITTVEKWLADL